MQKKGIICAAAALLAALSLSSCMDRDISLEDLAGSSSGVTVSCTTSRLSLKPGEHSDVTVTVSGVRKDTPVSCLSSDPDIAEAYEIDARTIRVRGVAEGKATVSVTCEGSDAVKIEVTVSE